VTSYADLVPGPGKRRIVAGGTRAGKSAHQEWGMRYIQRDRPDCMQLLIDTKPRFRASTEPIVYPHWRKDAASRYSDWTAGPVVPNSVVVDLYSRHPFRGLWDKPGEIAIMQSGDETDWRRMLQLTRGFARANLGGRERRVIVDEVLDFYQRNTFSIDGKHDEFYRISRAGGEHNVGIDLGAHRFHGLPPLHISMVSILDIFHLRHDGDMRYVREYGVPDEHSPQDDYVFYHYEVQPGGKFSKRKEIICHYPDSYLAQLATT
jgi:hypothetical protein